MPSNSNPKLNLIKQRKAFPLYFLSCSLNKNSIFLVETNLVSTWSKLSDSPTLVGTFCNAVKG